MSSHTSRSHLAPTLIGVTAVIVWGVAIPSIKLIVEEIGTLLFLGAVYGLSGLLCLANAHMRGASVSRELLRSRMFWLRGICFVFHEVCLNVAVFLVDRENLPVVILINYLWPTFVILFSVPIAGVVITRRRWFLAGTCIVVASMAVELLSDIRVDAHHLLGGSDLVAYGIALVGAMFWGLYSAITRRYGLETGGGWAAAYYQLAIGSVLPFALVLDGGALVNASSVTLWALPLYSSVLFLSYLAWDFGVSKGNVVILSLAADFIPWLSLLTTTLALGVALHATTLVSAATLVLGAMITRYGTLPTEPRSRSDLCLSVLRQIHDTRVSSGQDPSRKLTFLQYVRGDLPPHL